MMSLLILGLFFFFALNIPIAFSMILTSLLYLIIKGDIPLIVVVQQIAVGTDKYLLLAIPFFFLAGELMNAGGIMDRLVRLSKALVGHIPGGLGHVNVVESMIFAGMSGSAVSDVTAMGFIEIEMMRRMGYGSGFAAAITGASATIGPVVPPSIPFVIYGGITGVSVGKLFLGGIVPGVLMGLFLMVAIYILAVRRGYERSVRPPLLRILREIFNSIPILVLPLIIIGGILSGVFTPTEAAVVAAVYAFSLCTIIFKTTDVREVFRLMIRVGLSTAKLMFIIAAASLFGWIMARENAPLLMTKTFLSISNNPFIVLLMINVLLFVLGCVMETIAVMVILVPVLTPLVQSLGIDLVHFGVMITLNLMIGLITPPVGMVMYAVISIAKVSMIEFAQECLPFIIALLAVLFLVTYVPSTVLWVPSLFLE